VKPKIIGLLVATVLVLAVAFTAAAPAVPNANAFPAAAPRPAKAPAADPAQVHPEIRDAIASMRKAKERMRHAAHDFGGHRAEALRVTDEAIRQLEICLRFDKD
jgi:hypothetical protein